MGLSDLVGDRRTVDAVLRNITVIGEAARNIPTEVMVRHPEIPWREMGDFRNVVVHMYFGIDMSILWETIQNDLPRMEGPLLALLDLTE